ncbi:hypothetical protein NDU88_010831 [Pleurodeles waltl]|uniref:Uncharacterized protein n=1 Tax=Pleurodeles waltl TaxID=8319 RepID=A0AAV7PVZ8_PLEWA|nr:hypothetical protein NDU88_010831 [Pleurodeles waltl]
MKVGQRAGAGCGELHHRGGSLDPCTRARMRCIHYSGPDVHLPFSCPPEHLRTETRPGPDDRWHACQAGRGHTAAPGPWPDQGLAGGSPSERGSLTGLDAENTLFSFKREAVGVDNSVPCGWTLVLEHLGMALTSQ